MAQSTRDTNSSDKLGSVLSGVYLLPHMRRFRRLTAIVTSLLMVHLATVGGTAACTLGNDSQGAAVTRSILSVGAPAHLHAMPKVAHVASESPHVVGTMHRQGAESSPAQRCDHCGSSCADVACCTGGHCTSAQMRSVSAQERTVLGLVDAIRVRLDVPRLVSIAPETPPPRA